MLLLGWVWIIDPYGVSPIQLTIPHVNVMKPKRINISRQIKPYEVWLRYQPRTIFMGTSRIHQSMDPALLDGTRFAPAYNASVPASSLGQNLSYLEYYLKVDPALRTVFVELFLYNFLGQPQQQNRALQSNVFITTTCSFRPVPTQYGVQPTQFYTTFSIAGIRAR